MLGLVLVSTFGLLAFEAYYFVFSCQVSSHYRDSTVYVLKRSVEVMERLQLPYWIDFATLLNILRDEDHINVWDHDADSSMVLLDDAQRRQFELALREVGLETHYEADRGMLQIWEPGVGGPHAPHFDVFMWKEEYVRDGGASGGAGGGASGDKEDDEHVMISLDDDVYFRRRRWSHVFPLKKVRWLGIDVTIPADAHDMSGR